MDRPNYLIYHLISCPVFPAELTIPFSCNMVGCASFHPHVCMHVRTKQRCQYFTLLIVIFTSQFLVNRAFWILQCQISQLLFYWYQDIKEWDAVSLHGAPSQRLCFIPALHKAYRVLFCASQTCALYLLQIYQTPILQSERNLNDFCSPNIHQYLMSGSGSPFQSLMLGELFFLTFRKKGRISY
jgi:hypothetical protein